MRRLFFISGLALLAGAALAQSNTTASTTEKSETNSPNRAFFLGNAAIQYEDEGEYKEAEQAYLRALSADSNNPSFRFRLGTLYIQMNRMAEAVEILEKLAQEYPNNEGIENNLAWVYATSGKLKNAKLALRHAREAILAWPESPNLWNTLAEAYYVCGQYKEALRTSEFAIRLLKDMKGSEKEIAAFEAQRAKILRAEQSYNRLMKKEEDSGK